MNKNLVLMGGSKGVGKTSLARTVSSILGFEYINTGERFRKYRPDFDNKFVQELINAKGNFIIDTHYATSSSKTHYDFHIGIDEKCQMLLRSDSNYSGKVILINADPKIILERRKRDGEERRCLELEQIIKENNANSEYSRIYASCLDLPYLSLRNEDLSIRGAINKLLEIIKNE